MRDIAPESRIQMDPTSFETIPILSSKGIREYMLPIGSLPVILALFIPILLMFGFSEKLAFLIPCFIIISSYTLVFGFHLLSRKPHLDFFLLHRIAFSILVLFTLALFVYQILPELFKMQLQPDLVLVLSVMLLAMFGYTSIFISYMEEINCFVDLQTKKVEIKYRSLIFLASKKVSINRGKIEKGILEVTKGSPASFTFETVEKEKIRIPNKSSLDALKLGTLNLVKFLQLPITLKGETFPIDMESKPLTPEVLQQHKETFFHIEQNIKLLDADPCQFGWEEIGKNPFIFQEVETSSDKIKGLILVILLAYSSLSFLLVIYAVWGIVDLMRGVPIEFLILPMIAMFVSIPGMLGLLLVFPLYKQSKIRLIKISENGLQTGFKILRGKKWSVCWPYEFIRGLQIVEEEVDEEEEDYHVSIDFFLGTKVL
ncbi:MAG: hypothetical protein ACFFBD_17895, partial [Candidatus Hodarchaeota archaeon]